MVSKKVFVGNASGLHLKPAAVLNEKALSYQSLITFTHGKRTANAKSLLSVLGACVRGGEEIELVCIGEDEREALAGLSEIIEGGLGEK